jgi:N6-adenosine-specific RNA methylase IME4
MFGEEIADGRARCKSAFELGMAWQEIPKSQFEGDEATLLEFLLIKNVTRRHLKASQRAMIAAKLATMAQGARTDLPRICGMSQPVAAARLSVSVRLVQHAENVRNQGIPELQDAVNNGVLKVSVADEASRLAPAKQRQLMAEAIEKSNPKSAFLAAMRRIESDERHNKIRAKARKYDLGNKRYVIVLGDIPWEVALCRGAQPYPRLSIPQICEFRVDGGRLIRDVAAENALMLLWIPDCLVFQLPRIAEAWGGWRFRHFLPWPKFAGTPGSRALFQHELVAVYTRGNFPPPNTCMPTLIVQSPLKSGNGFYTAPAHDARQASKPDRLYEMIEQTYPQYFGPETIESPLALELFARNYRPRWDGQGFEYPGRPGGTIKLGSEAISVGHAEAEIIDPESEKAIVVSKATIYRPDEPRGYAENS